MSDISPSCTSFSGYSDIAATPVADGAGVAKSVTASAASGVTSLGNPDITTASVSDCTRIVCWEVTWTDIEVLKP